MKRLIFLLLWFSTVAPYDFHGTHYIASYKKCESKKLDNVTILYAYFINAVIESGATILSHHMEKFEPNGMTGLMILSESHASIHTYPEHESCFVDIFTCGSHCDWKKFEKVMVEYLNCKVIDRKVIIRN